MKTEKSLSNCMHDSKFEQMYQVVLTTHDSRIAKIYLHGSHEQVIKSNLSLKEAQDCILDEYNRYYSDERGYAPNWGIAVCLTRGHCDGAHNTHQDGTRSFSYDGRTILIKEMDDENN